MTQNYHRYLNLPFTVDKPESFVDMENSDYIILENDIVPQIFVDWLNERNLYPIHTGAFYTAPEQKIQIHCDTIELGNHVNINFTWGSEESTTRWWKLKEGKEFEIVHISDDDVEVEEDGMLTAKEEDCDLIFEKVINRPSLINAGVLHSTHNPTEVSRWTLSVVIGHKDRPNKLLQWKDAYEILKDVIDESDLS